VNKVTEFKYIIKEFHEFDFPKIMPRDLNIPETSKIISIIGSRRAGKTFYFYQIIQNLLKNDISKENILYINFEDDRLLPLEVDELNDLMEAYYELYPDSKKQKKYFFFDEIQNIKNWEIFVRRICDKEKIKIYITGSSSKLLSKEIATSLRGRTLTFHLHPLSFNEFLKFKNIKMEKNYEYSSQRFKLSDYYEMFIYRDLVERFSIRNTRLLKMLTKYLITNISSIFSINSYYNYTKKEMKVSKETILEYISHLSDINLIYLVPIFSYSLKVQQVNPSKTYCIDTGLRNAVALKFSEDVGRLTENIVYIELKRRGKEIFYWKNKQEIDFVIKEKNNKLTAINVNYTDKINEREIKGLQEFQKEYKSKISRLIILSKNLEEKKEEINIIPLYQFGNGYLHHQIKNKTIINRKCFT
jgi:predicted AAA+ superfamily ATPase